MSSLGSIAFLSFVGNIHDSKLIGFDIVNTLSAYFLKAENVIYAVKYYPRAITHLMFCGMSDKEQRLRIKAVEALVNFSSHGPGALYLKDCNYNGVPYIIKILELMLNPYSDLSDVCAMLLTNFTQTPGPVGWLVKALSKNTDYLYSLFDAITDFAFNSKGCCLDLVSVLVSNLCQSQDFRRMIISDDQSLFNRLTSVLIKDCPKERRQGIVSCIKNCTLDSSYHKILLSEQFGLLELMLYPLAGPEEIDEEDTQKLLPLLQYLPPTKVREEDPRNRKLLLQALFLFCATSFGREYFRDNGVYIILKLYYEWETVEKNLYLCERLIGLLIRTEEEIGYDNLLDIPVPDDVNNLNEGIIKMHMESKH